MGNLLGDLVKKSDLERLPEGIRQGVFMHRAIDHFTDNHIVVKSWNEKLRPIHQKYSPVVSDILCDYFLSKYWNDYSETPIDTFSSSAYQNIKNHRSWIPNRWSEKIMMMVNHNWLRSYGDKDHLNKTFLRVKERAKFDSSFEFAVDDLEKNEEIYSDYFKEFFHEIIHFANDWNP